MKKPAAMMWYPEAWLASPRVAAMPAAARAGYFDILNSMWVNGGSLSDDDDQLRAASRLERAEWKKHKKRILACLTADGGEITQDRLAEEYARTEEIVSKRSKAARKRWNTKSNANADANADANASKVHHQNGNFAHETETETETKEESPPFPPHDGFDGYAAMVEVIGLWPKREGVKGGRIAWELEAGNNPNFEDWAKRALGIARKVRAADPSGDDLKYLPSLKRFLEERVDDDWDAKIASWRPAKRDLEAEMRAAVEAR